MELLGYTQLYRWAGRYTTETSNIRGTLDGSYFIVVGGLHISYLVV